MSTLAGPASLRSTTPAPHPAYNTCRRRSNLWAYAGADGGDFDHELSLPNTDFGTFHSYPDYWSKTVGWTEQWIRDHGEAGRKAGKPVVHEEYGWLAPGKRQGYTGKSDTTPRTEVLSKWQAISLEEKISLESVTACSVLGVAESLPTPNSWVSYTRE